MFANTSQIHHYVFKSDVYIHYSHISTLTNGYWLKYLENHYSVSVLNLKKATNVFALNGWFNANLRKSIKLLKDLMGTMILFRSMKRVQFRNS